MDDLVSGLILVGFPLVFAWMVVRLSEGWMRKKILERDPDPELVEKLWKRRESPSRYPALKWGMVAVALGLGILVEAVLPYDFDDPVAYGVLLLFGGIALILYYVYVDLRQVPPGRGSREPRRGESPGARSTGSGASSPEAPR